MTSYRLSSHARQSRFPRSANSAAIPGSVPAPALAYDIVLRGGYLIDPRQRVDGSFDIAVTYGRVASVESSIDPSSGHQSLDESGLFVTPGLVEIHAHVRFDGNTWRVGRRLHRPSRKLCFCTGITPMVDAGSSEWRDFEGFKETVIDRAETSVLALVNIADRALVSDEGAQGDSNPGAIARLAGRYLDVVIGVKLARSDHRNGVPSTAQSRPDAKRGFPSRSISDSSYENGPYGNSLKDVCFRAPVPWVGLTERDTSTCGGPGCAGSTSTSGTAGAASRFSPPLPPSRRDSSPIRSRRICLWAE